jgi:hypothetical protein
VIPLIAVTTTKKVFWSAANSIATLIKAIKVPDAEMSALNIIRWGGRGAIQSDAMTPRIFVIPQVGRDLRHARAIRFYRYWPSKATPKNYRFMFGFCGEIL